MSLFPLSIGLRRLIRTGSLEVIGPDGQRELFGTEGAEPSVAVRISERRLLWPLLFHPSLHVGQAYMDGTLRIEKGTLADLLAILLQDSTDWYRRSLWADMLRRIDQALYLQAVLNWIARSRRNVEYHYDLSQALYDAFLDADKQYSCAYFRSPHDTLDEAQLHKKQHLASKLLIRPGQRILDIGSGWGGLALYLAQHFDVEVVGLTLSREQHALSTRRAAEMGLARKVRFKLLDYREEDDRYDRIVSVGMFEHVGLPHYHTFFAKMRDLLADDGVALLHTIGRQGRPAPINAWLRRNIFPGAYLPSLSQLAPRLERLGYWLTDFENLRLHYASTLKAWNERFQKNRSHIAELYDERFCRMWEFYLQSAEAGFRYSGLSVFQLQLAKRIDVVPLTRDYMFDTERRLMRLDDGEAEVPRLAGE